MIYVGNYLGAWPAALCGSAVSLQAGHYLQSRAADLSPVSAVTAVIAAPGSADLST